MKYKDYYAALGLERNATEQQIKKAYRKLAHKYHPDVSKEPGAEERFKEIAEAYQTLKDPEKRAAYDQLGTHAAGQDFQPPPDWRSHFYDAPFMGEDLDLADLFAHLRTGARPHRVMRGQDFEVTVPISIEQAFEGTEVNLDLQVPEIDEHGRLRRVPHAFTARIPRGATEGQRLRVPGKGGKGVAGGRDGDLYLTIVLRPHALYRVSGHDLYLDLPLAPWEAVLGASVEIQTPAGRVRLKVPPGTQAGQHLRLPRRGLPRPHEGHGDLFAIVQIVVPSGVSEAEQALYRQLASASAFRPRAAFDTPPS